MLSVVMLNVVMLNVVMLNVVMLSVVMLNVVMQSVVILNAVMLSVMAPPGLLCRELESCSDKCRSNKSHDDAKNETKTDNKMLFTISSTAETLLEPWRI